MRYRIDEDIFHVNFKKFQIVWHKWKIRKHSWAKRYKQSKTWLILVMIIIVEILSSIFSKIRSFAGYTCALRPVSFFCDSSASSDCFFREMIAHCACAIQLHDCELIDFEPIGTYSVREDLLLFHSILVAAHASEISTSLALRVRAVINTHDWQALFVDKIVFVLSDPINFMRSELWVEICLRESLACRLTPYKITCLDPEEETIQKSIINFFERNVDLDYLQDWGQEEKSEKTHENTNSAPVLVPWVWISILVRLVNIVNKFVLKVYR